MPRKVLLIVVVLLGMLPYGFAQAPLDNSLPPGAVAAPVGGPQTIED